MLIGIPKEVKNHEYRVGLTPAAVKELVKQGHDVVVDVTLAQRSVFPTATILPPVRVLPTMRRRSFPKQN